MNRLQRLRTRLVLGRLWLRWSYPFRWAHKPLCDRFRHDVLRLGHVHVCRSCVIAYLGLATTAAACIAWRPETGVIAPGMFLAVGVPTVVLSLPRWYKRWPRRMRDVLRFGMGATLALCGHLALSGHPLSGFVGAFTLLAFWKLYLSQRRRRRLRVCDGCQELRDVGVCSGYARQAERIRQYEQVATEWVVGSGFDPS